MSIVMLLILVLHLLVTVCCVSIAKPSVSFRHPCKANFGNQDLEKAEQVVLGRTYTMKCTVKEWKLCGGGPPYVHWFFNDTQLKQRHYYPGLKVKRTRLSIALLTPVNEGVYKCMLPNGLNRTFTVTARSSYNPQGRIRDLLPQDPADEQVNRVYWLPSMLNTREQYVATTNEANMELFTCIFYVASNQSTLVEQPRVTWTFTHLVMNKLITLDSFHSGDRQQPRPHVIVKTKECSCHVMVVKNAWRRRNPTGKCYTTKLLFRHFHDEEIGRYTCHIGGGHMSAHHQLSMNFTISTHLDILTNQDLSKTKKRRGMVDKGRPDLDFDRDRSACLGRNLTLKCDAIPSQYELFIYKQIFNASEPSNITLKVLAASKPPDSISIVDPLANVSNGWRVTFPNEGKVWLTLTNLTFDDAGIYQCSAGKPWAINEFSKRIMRLVVEDCSVRSNPSGPPSMDSHKENSMEKIILITVVAAAFLLILAILLICFFYRSQRLKKSLEHRCVVVVQPSANTTYPSFLRRCNSSNNIDSLRSSNTGSCSGGSSCLTPSSTLDSTASPCSSSLLTPLRPPEVRIQPMRRTRRFARTTSFSSSSTRWIRSRSNNLTYELPDQMQWELPRHCLTIGIEVGEGAFGVVKRGQLLSADGQTQTRVAVKMLKEDFTEEELTDLIKEIEVMKMLDPHPHIIRLLGVCTRNGPLCLVNEFAPFGNLRDFLRERRPKSNETAHERIRRIGLARGLLTYQHLIDFSMQVAAGLEYLSARSVVHRDIAARNVLVGESFEAKIADFGMSRHVVNYYRKTTEGRLPVKWLPPEALFDYVFTREGDVWSFGILMWEIFSLGGTPYPSIPVERLFGLLRQGYRNDPPFYAFPQIYDLMRRCWDEQPSVRPRFTELRQQLERLRGVEEYAQILRESPYCDLAVSHAYIPMEA